MTEDPKAEPGKGSRIGGLEEGPTRLLGVWSCGDEPAL
jgi:hypothetical protein